MSRDYEVTVLDHSELPTRERTPEEERVLKEARKVWEERGYPEIKATRACANLTADDLSITINAR